MRSARLAAVVALGCLSGGLPAFAEGRVHALIIGINKYASVERATLKAAVADAKDLAGALRSRKIDDVTLLTDSDADRAGFKGAWDAMVARAQPGDTLFFSFAGHGILEPEKSKERHTPDGFNKGFILNRYDEAKNPDEILRDEDLYDLFKAQADRGVKILFVVDACHAGAGTRDVRAGQPPFRVTFYKTEKVTELPPASTYKRRPDIPGLATFAATIRDKTIEEVQIDGELRGAFSWAIARAIERKGVFPGGRITPAALQDYIAPLVREKVGAGRQQVPEYHYVDRDAALMDFAEGGTPLSKSVAAFPELKDLPVAFNAGPSPAVPGVKPVTDKLLAALIYDKARSQVLNGAGDVIAAGITETGLEDAVAAARLVGALTTALQQRGSPLQVTLTNDAGPVVKPLKTGEKIELTVPAPGVPYVTIFDLNADGTVQYLYPITSARVDVSNPDPAATDPKGAHPFPAVVTGPFGKDTVIAIATQDEPKELRASLADLHQRPHGAAALYPILQTQLAKTPYRLGVLSQFTCRQILKDGLCDTNLAP